MKKVTLPLALLAIINCINFQIYSQTDLVYSSTQQQNKPETSYDIKPNYLLTPENVYNELEQIYTAASTESYIGELVSQLEHALQTALVALKENADEEAILAALFHDIGHRYVGKNISYMAEFGVQEHEKIGSLMLQERGFSNKIVTMINGHVDAKRYRVFKDKNYHEKLTYASQQTLIAQGGPMSAEEAQIFEQKPYFKETLLLRSWEEKAKIPNLPTPNFSYFKPIILKHLTTNLIS